MNSLARRLPAGGGSVVAGALLAASFLPLLRQPDLRGPTTWLFLAGFLLAAVFYALAVARLDRDRLPLHVIWGFALLFRLLWLTTTPSLSDDVYRYIWDGHLLNQGVSPYALPVDAPQLDPYAIPARQLVNNSWMASPYLPAAQLYFGLLAWLEPQQLAIYQLGAVLLDLLTGWLVMQMLFQVGIARRAVLIYLWNPLVVVEFAHGAHVDALMLCGMLAAFYFLLPVEPGSARRGRVLASALSLAAAVLSKGLAILVMPLLARRWRGLGLAGFAAAVLGALAWSAAGPGWGLASELDGRGLFGALRIYQQYWRFNAGLYHWLAGLDVLQPELLRTLLAALTGLAALFAGLLAWRGDHPQQGRLPRRNRRLLRLALLPLGVYLLLAHTVHPWYVTLIVPFLPFLRPAAGETGRSARWIWPGVYFSLAAALSYLTYLDPQNWREYELVRLVEYLPLYALLLWAAWPFLARWLHSRKALQA